MTTPDREQRYEITGLIGPCTAQEAEDLLIRVADTMGDPLGACWALHPFADPGTRSLDTPDREQIRRDAKSYLGSGIGHPLTQMFARHCLALLDTLEKAEAEIDQFKGERDLANHERDQAEHDLASHKVALDATVHRAEQAERERDELTYWQDRCLDEKHEARLATVPALVEALEEIDRRERQSTYTSIYAAPHEFANIAREALAAYHQASK